MPASFLEIVLEQPDPLASVTLQARMNDLLSAISEEQTPERLLKLACELQIVLNEKQRAS